MLAPFASFSKQSMAEPQVTIMITPIIAALTKAFRIGFRSRSLTIISAERRARSRQSFAKGLLANGRRNNIRPAGRRPDWQGESERRPAVTVRRCCKFTVVALDDHAANGESQSCSMRFCRRLGIIGVTEHPISTTATAVVGSRVKLAGASELS